MKVLVTARKVEAGVALLQKEFTVDIKHDLPAEDLLKIISEYDALLVRADTKVTKEVIEAGSLLKVIGRAGVGVDNIDVWTATQKGIIVLNAPSGNTIAATEHTIAMMLALARKIPQAYCSIKDGQWRNNEFVGVEVCGRTLGIIGLGRIGWEVAKRALAMGMNVLVYDPYISVERTREQGLELVELDELFGKADFITLHLPLTKETKYLMNKDAFAKVKRGVRIVNCARGGIIEERELAEAIKQGIVAGAALDVFEKEPVDPVNPLLTLGNVIFTPHMGGLTEEAVDRVAIDTAEGIRAALRGEPVRTAVNMPLRNK